MAYPLHPSIPPSLSLDALSVAVDYTVHLIHSYNEAPFPDRLRRSRQALTEMGVSVVSGALTTFLAAAPLFSAAFVFFSQFGTFIGMITCFSIFWAIFYLMTACTVIGPESRKAGGAGAGADPGLKGDIEAIKRLQRCGRPRPPSDPESSGMQGKEVAVAEEVAEGVGAGATGEVFVDSNANIDGQSISIFQRGVGEGSKDGGGDGNRDGKGDSGGVGIARQGSDDLQYEAHL